MYISIYSFLRDMEEILKEKYTHKSGVWAFKTEARFLLDLGTFMFFLRGWKPMDSIYS